MKTQLQAIKMKSQLQIIKDLVKKYSNDYELGGMIRRYITDEYWLRPKKEQESNWEKELDKIHRTK